MKAESTACRDQAVKEAGELELRLSAQSDQLDENLMGLISHNAKMYQEQRAIDSAAAGKRMDEITESNRVISEQMANMFKGMKAMSDQLAQLIDDKNPPTSTERPKSNPRTSRTPRVAGATSVAGAVAVIQQSDASPRAQTGM